MNLQELVTQLDPILTMADYDEDNYGQVIIYTNWKLDDDDNLVPMTDADFDL